MGHIELVGRLTEWKKLMVGWFLCLMAYQLFLGYLMPKPLSLKNSSGAI